MGRSQFFDPLFADTLNSEELARHCPDLLEGDAVPFADVAKLTEFGPGETHDDP